MDKKALIQLLLPLVRHGLTAAGTLLGYAGLKDDSVILEVTGIVATLLGLWWSKCNSDQKNELHAELIQTKAELHETKQALGEEPPKAKE